MMGGATFRAMSFLKMNQHLTNRIQEINNAVKYSDDEQ